MSHVKHYIHHVVTWIKNFSFLILIISRGWNPERSKAFKCLTCLWSGRSSTSNPNFLAWWKLDQHNNYYLYFDYSFKTKVLSAVTVWRDGKWTIIFDNVMHGSFKLFLRKLFARFFLGAGSPALFLRTCRNTERCMLLYCRRIDRHFLISFMDSFSRASCAFW